MKSPDSLFVMKYDAALGWIVLMKEAIKGEFTLYTLDGHCG
jgi:hypothetical protein